MTNKRRGIDFDDLNSRIMASIETFLDEELPNGKRQGHEYVVKNPKRVDEHQGSFSINITTGAWSDFADVTGAAKGGDPVSLYAYLHDCNQGKAGKALVERYGTAPVSRKKRLTSKKKHETWTPIVPVTGDAPDPTRAHYHYGQPTKTWTYFDRQGHILGYIWRVDRPDKPKEIFPLTFCRNTAGKREWRFRTWPTPRPLYGLDRLEKKPDAPVLLVEGEKCADAGAYNLPDVAVLSWPGGCKAIKKVDFSELAGRRVYLWPDRDEPGFLGMFGIYELIREIAAEVRFVRTPPGKPKGWDIADAVAENWGDLELSLHIKQHAADPEEMRHVYEDLLRPKRTLTDDQVQEAAEEIVRDGGQYRLTDLGNARRLVDTFGKIIRYNAVPTRKWFIWEGKRWVEDATKMIYKHVQDIIKQIFEEAATIKGDWDEGKDERKRLFKGACSLEAMNRQRAMVAMAETQQEVAMTSEQLDRDPYLFNAANCTLDLSKGDDIIRKDHDQEDYITMISPVFYEPDEECPKWIAFLEEIFKGNEEVIPFIQRAVGYSLTGDVSEQCLFFAYGTGANGKSVFFNTIEMLFGHYYGRAPAEMLMQQKYNQIPTDVADLRGMRFVVCSELPDNRRFNEERIKDLTGGDPIKARRMREDFFTFNPTHKLWMYGNHKPVIYGNDTGIWRRLKIIPFTITIPAEHRLPMRELLGGFKAELSGIMNWALEGYLMYRERGFCDPPSIIAAAEDYRSEMDLLGMFLSECCKKDTFATLVAKRLWEKYHGWCEDRGEHHLGYNRFLSKLRERGIEVKPGSGNKMMVYDLEIIDGQQQEEMDI